MKIIKIILVNLIVFLAFLFLLEGAIRLTWRMSPLQGEIYRASANKILRYELKPNLNTIYESYEVVTNSEGFRGPEYDLQKPADTYRVVLIGDSVCFGKYASEITLAVRLEKKLRSICQGRKYEVLNMGVEGYNSIQELERLRITGLKYRPDLVIVYYCMNDPDYPEYYFAKNRLNRYSMLARYVQYRYKKFLVKRDRKRKGVRSLEENFRYLYNSSSWDYTKEALLKMGDLSQSAGVPMVLLIAPEMSEAVKNYREGYPFYYIHDQLATVRHPNIHIVDPVREYSRRNVKKEEIVHWAYPNAQGNDIIIDYLLRELGAHKINFCDHIP